MPIESQYRIFNGGFISKHFPVVHQRGGGVHTYIYTHTYIHHTHTHTHTYTHTHTHTAAGECNKRECNAMHFDKNFQSTKGGEAVYEITIFINISFKNKLQICLISRTWYKDSNDIDANNVKSLYIYIYICIYYVFSIIGLLSL